MQSVITRGRIFVWITKENVSLMRSNVHIFNEEPEAAHFKTECTAPRRDPRVRPIIQHLIKRVLRNDDTKNLQHTIS